MNGDYAQGNDPLDPVDPLASLGNADPLQTTGVTGVAGASGMPAMPGAAGSANCTPLQCETAMRLIGEARDPSLGMAQLGQLRTELAHCTPCRSAFDLEVKLRTTMTPTMSALPTPDLANRISETLARVDLSKLEITDF